VLLATINARAQFSAKVYHDGGNSNEWPGKMIKTRDGNVAMCGYADSVYASWLKDENGVEVPNSLVRTMVMNTHVIKMTPEGQTIWKRVYWDGVRAPGQLCAKSIAETEDGGFVVTGWRREGVKIRLDSSGQEIYPVDPGIANAFVLRLDKDGNELWRRALYPHASFVDSVNSVDSMAYEEAVRASGADILVNPKMPWQTNGNIIVLGVADIFSKAKNYQDDADIDENRFTQMPFLGKCFQDPQNSSKYLWIMELRENDTRVRDFCDTMARDKESATHKVDTAAFIVSKVPAIVKSRIFLPSTEEGTGRFSIDYTFSFTKTFAPGTTGLSYLQRNGVNQDQVFASMTRVLTVDKKEHDGYAITVNAKALPGNDENPPDKLLDSKGRTVVAPYGFSILRLGRDLDETRWWRLFYTKEAKGGRLLKVRSNGIIHHLGEVSGESYLHLCGQIECDTTYSKCFTSSVQRDGNMGAMFCRLKMDGTPVGLFSYQSLTVPSGNYYARNEAAYSLAQFPYNGVTPESDMGVALFGGRYATEANEPGYRQTKHQGWVLLMGWRKFLPYTPVSVSIGKSDDNMIVSGVTFPTDSTWLPFEFRAGRPMALGCTVSGDYRNSTTDKLDLWVSRLDRLGKYETPECGSVDVPVCVSDQYIAYVGIKHQTCNEWYMENRGPFCGMRELKEEYECK
jgi:hypothetical protein